MPKFLASRPAGTLDAAGECAGIRFVRWMAGGDMEEDAGLVTLDDIRAAASRLPAEVLRTPLLPSAEMRDAAGTEVWFKAENLQVTGSYKARAAYTVLSRLSDGQRARGAAISSS